MALEQFRLGALDIYADNADNGDFHDFDDDRLAAMNPMPAEGAGEAVTRAGLFSRRGHATSPSATSSRSRSTSTSEGRK